QALRQTNRDRIKTRDRRTLVYFQFYDDIENARAIQMRGEAAGVRKSGDLLLVIQRQHAASDRILQRQQSGAREMIIIRFDRGSDTRQRYAAMRLVLERLRLNAAEDGRPALLVFIG